MAVPVMKNNYAANETKVFTYLTSKMGLNRASACGVLANIQHESGFNPTIHGDLQNGVYTSYGLCQWHKTRYSSLQSYCNRNNLNYTTVEGQLEYLNYELNQSFGSLVSILKQVPDTADGAWEAGAQWCARFEVPAGYGSWNNGVLTLGSTSKTRGNLARDTYWSAYSNSSVSASSTPIDNKGSKIVAEAKKHIGVPYVWGGESPSGFDCSGFVYYVYKQAINYNWGRTTAYYLWKNYGTTVDRNNLMAGDLLFFTDTYSTGNSPNISHVGIATGNGTEFIQASGSAVNTSTLGNTYWGGHFYQAKRVLDASETSYLDDSGSVVGPSISTPGTGLSGITADLAIAHVDNYLEIIKSTIANLEKVNETDSSGRNYGYLIDLTNGGEFKFYVPEFSESTSANWDDISIIGRSTSVKAYNSTQSRSIDISLQLVAGIGMYANGADKIDSMIKDVEFVKSLEYPDYSKSIVLPPPVVLLYLNPAIKLRGVVSQVRAEYKKPYDSKNRPMICELTFTVVQNTSSPPDYNDIRNRTDYSY